MTYMSRSNLVEGNNYCFNKKDFNRLVKSVGVSKDVLDRSWIGCGEYSDVYDIGGGKVLRISNYPEYELASYLKDNPTYGFVKVFDAFEVEDYSIAVCEKLYPIRIEGIAWGNFIRCFGNYDPLSMYFEAEEWLKKTRYLYEIELEHFDKVVQSCVESGIRIEDLHSENWLMTKDEEIVICDLGFAHFVDKFSTRIL